LEAAVVLALTVEIPFFLVLLRLAEALGSTTASLLEMVAAVAALLAQTTATGMTPDITEGLPVQAPLGKATVGLIRVETGKTVEGAAAAVLLKPVELTD
jgi:hypothetical protein